MKITITKIFYTLLLILTGLGAFAQSGKSSVSGKLVDDKGAAMDYATISLLNAADSAIVKGTLTTEAGTYLLDNIKPGNYIIKATNIGYAKAVSAVFNISADNARFIVPNLVMHQNTRALNTVTITSTQPLIERKIDRTVMNIENSVLAAGNTAFEILQKAPGVDVDKDDNISLNGKQGVTVMINDKLTYLSAAQLATLLRSTDGTTIKSIEIITNPSAKYDAAGNSGIINILLKKNKQSGTNGSATIGGGYSKNPRDNMSLNLNHKEGNLNLFGTFSRGDNPHYRNFSIDRVTTDNVDKQTYFTQTSQMTQTNHYNNYNIGADLDATSKNTMGFVISGYSNSEHDVNTNHTLIGATPAIVDSSLTTGSAINQTYRNFALNLNDRYKIDTLGQELSVDLDYSKFNNNSIAQYNTDYFLATGGTQHASQLLRNQTPSVIDIRSGKADYSKPLNKTMKLETGVKFSNVKTDNDLQAQKALTNGTYVNDTSRTNRFIYSEKIDAGYVNLNKEFKNGSVQLGLRAEYTQSNANLLGSTPVDRSYFNFFPSVFINRTLNKKNEIGFSYSRRIDRPNYDNLNPFIYYLDPYTYSQGNSFLKPQYTNNFELNYTYNKTVNVSLGYSKTTDVITELILTVGNKSFETHDNLQVQNSYNINVYSPYTITNWWTGNFNFNGFYLGFKSNGFMGGTVDNGQAAFVFRTTQTFLFGGFKGELSGDYHTALTYGIYHLYARKEIDAGISHSFANKKLNIKLAMDDIFNMRTNDLSSNDLNNNFIIRQKGDTRLLKLNFTYNFGNSKIKKREHHGGAEDEKGRVGGGN